MSLPGLAIKGHTFHWGSRTYIMGVINVTPDSFSDGGKFSSPEGAKQQAASLIAAGADILDIGGESARPFSEPVTLEEELRRVIPAIREIRKISDCPISVDTVKAEMAEAALSEGADIINDISALRFDPRMADVASALEAPVILMHMKGTPRYMQVNPSYEDVVGEVKLFLEKRVTWANSKGIPREKILIDPGIGFGKNFHDNLVLINHLQEFTELGVPVVVGVSRKAFLGTITGIKEAEERDVATLGAVAASSMRGADLVRVHNVALTRQVLQVVDAICRESL
ncbi:MAG: dihydropteroate synthase [Deltaproteobacteria bacterium]|nr:dihydropteroate synthase [Deltaproteobacteria bacterium]MBW1946937.1 dihydropteroate synthase [Deltaproteobacteria bacterium]MBW1966375.1 dihydropteroate synthase [Deltaproteobacteria bacterium]MBW2097593.1 dihydropteroate synthase [Deltaproteobacteria bacterium]PXF55508.1 MAG: dihydropteroate synthase [Deltaproteobacteria bacterium]